jgi:hypothetical protein
MPQRGAAAAWLARKNGEGRAGGKKRQILFSPAPPCVHEFDGESPAARRLELRRQNSESLQASSAAVAAELEARNLAVGAAAASVEEQLARLATTFNEEMHSELQSWGLGAEGSNEELAQRLDLAAALRRRANLRVSGFCRPSSPPAGAGAAARATLPPGPGSPSSRTRSHAEPPALPRMPVDMSSEELSRELAARKVAAPEHGGRLAKVIALEEAVLKDGETVFKTGDDGYEFGRRFISVERFVRDKQLSDAELREELARRALPVPRKKVDKEARLQQVMQAEIDREMQLVFREELIAEVQRRGLRPPPQPQQQQQQQQQKQQQQQQQQEQQLDQQPQNQPRPGALPAAAKLTAGPAALHVQLTARLGPHTAQVFEVRIAPCAPALVGARRSNIKGYRAGEGVALPNDREAAAEHGRLQLCGERGVAFCDTGSAQRSAINGVDLEPGVPYRIELRDKIKVGATLLEVTALGPDQAPAGEAHDSNFKSRNSSKRALSPELDDDTPVKKLKFDHLVGPPTPPRATTSSTFVSAAAPFFAATKDDDELPPPSSLAAVQRATERAANPAPGLAEPTPTPAEWGALSTAVIFDAFFRSGAFKTDYAPSPPRAQLGDAGQHDAGQHDDGQHGDGQHGDGQHGDALPGSSCLVM